MLWLSPESAKYEETLQMSSICIIRYAKWKGITFRAAHLISSVTGAIKKNSSIWFNIHRKKIGSHNIEFVREDDVTPSHGAAVALNVLVLSQSGVSIFLYIAQW